MSKPKHKPKQKQDQKQNKKFNVALIQLEEDYLAGEIDKDLYDELKSKYEHEFNN
jgi:hypothetical protein